MDFGFTDDQRDIQRTARDLLAERATPARVREHAEARTVDQALWRELSKTAGRGSPYLRSTAVRGSVRSSCRSSVRKLGRSLAPVPFLPSAPAQQP